MKRVSLRKPGFALFEVVEILADMFRVNVERRETFVSRIQQLQKAGLPAEANVGRGAKVRYTNWQIADLSLLLELLNCGITPGMLRDYFRPYGRNYVGIYTSGGLGWHVQESLPDNRVDLYELLRFNALLYLSRPRSSDDQQFDNAISRIDYGRSTDNVLEELTSGGPAITVNLTAHLKRLRRSVECVLPNRMDDITFYQTRSGTYVDLEDGDGA